MQSTNQEGLFQVNFELYFDFFQIIRSFNGFAAYIFGPIVLMCLYKIHKEKEKQERKNKERKESYHRTSL